MSGDPLFGDLFLGIGAMKAGTTWLYSVLDRHPELHFSMEKEVHYFYHRYVDSNLLSEVHRLRSAKERYLPRFDPERSNIDRVRQNLHWVSSYISRPVDDHWYRGLFDRRGRERYACDFSNLSAHLPVEAWPRIHDSCGALRVLYVMRDPVERLWSHTKFHLQMTQQLDKLDSWGPDDFRSFVMRQDNWRNAEYGAILRNLQSALPSETWMPMFYEDLHADQRAGLQRIERFLGISHFDYPQAILDKRPTESKKLPMPEFFPSLFEDEVARIVSEVCELGLEPPDSWQ